MRLGGPESYPKVVLVGDSGAGKTSISHCYTKSTASIKPTITANSVHCTERIGGKEIRFDLWDTAGQDSYKCLVPVYARDAVLAIVVFDRSAHSSFDNLSYWSEFLKNDVAIDSFIVVGNKSDLASEVTTEEAEKWCQANLAEYVETSAKTGAKIDVLFQMVAKKVAALTGEAQRFQLSPGDSGIILLNSKSEPKQACPC